MYWEEKIENIKRRFSQAEFRVPFTEWPDILKKIEAKFVYRNNSTNHFANWGDNLKDQVPIHTISEAALSSEMEKLNPFQNYWLVILTSNNPTARHLVYDCKPKSLNAVLSIAPGHFFIVHKKLEWLTYFQVDKGKKEIKVSKCGDAQTPFESNA